MTSSINQEKITVEYNFMSPGRKNVAFKTEDKIRSFQTRENGGSLLPTDVH